MQSGRDLLGLVREMNAQSYEVDPSLNALAARAGTSPFKLHRAFRSMIGESPKQYVLRLRLERAAVRLVASDDSVLEVALGAGFRSHEVFTRAFRRHFDATPLAYRAAALRDVSGADRARHTSIVERSGPCIGLYHLKTDSHSRRAKMPTLSIERRDVPAQPFLFSRAKVARSEIAKAIAEGLGRVFPYVMKAGLPIAGAPTVRYLTSGPGLLEMEIGVPVAVPAAAADGVEAGELPGGPAVVAVHGGAYEQLGDTYAAVERWMEANGFRNGGPAWESYVTDPGSVLDVKDWRTEVYWPIER